MQTSELSPIEAYKAIIDQLVNETSHGVAEKLVSEGAASSRAPEEAESNAFVRSLSTEQRRQLVHLLHSERVGAIHDVLAALSWWLQAGGLGWTFRSVPMPTDISGMGLHGDYVGRQNGWEWPK